MSLSAFCTQCRRTVYVNDDDTAVCPVCSNPLVATIEPPEDGSNGNKDDVTKGEEVAEQGA